MTSASKQFDWPVSSVSKPTGSQSETEEKKVQQNRQVDLIIRRCLDGETAAYNVLYQLYAGYIYRLIYSLLQNREDAEEVLQDAFEYAFRKLSNFDPTKSQFKTWLYRIAISRTRNKRRRKMLPTFSIQQKQDESNAEPFDIIDDSEPGPETCMESLARQQFVWNAIGELSIKLRETVILRHYEGLSYQEIGDILGIPAKTAESRMRLAHKALRNLLEGLEGEIG